MYVCPISASTKNEKSTVFDYCTVLELFITNDSILQNQIYMFIKL